MALAIVMGLALLIPLLGAVGLLARADLKTCTGKERRTDPISPDGIATWVAIIAVTALLLLTL